MYAGLFMDVAYSADQLREDSLDFIDGEFAMFQKVVVQLVAYPGLALEVVHRTEQTCHTGTVFQYQPNKVLGHNDLVQAGDVGVDELAMVMYLSGQVRVVLVGRL
jgi:hypothetical protein